MANKGGAKRLKRLAAPGFWPVEKRTFKWVVKPRPGPHPLRLSIPLLLVVRDILKLADTASEAKKIIHRRKILVDGRPRWDPKFPVGLMDVISIPEIEKHYRITSDPYKVLKLVEIPKEDADHKISKIIRKTTYVGGRIQITTHDGKNFLLDPASGIGECRVGDSIHMNLPSFEIKEIFPLKEGAPVLVVGGKRAGYIGFVEKIADLIEIRDLKDSNLVYRALARNVIVLGAREPVIKT